MVHPEAALHVVVFREPVVEGLEAEHGAVGPDAAVAIEEGEAYDVAAGLEGDIFCGVEKIISVILYPGLERRRVDEDDLPACS